jgi:SPP1 family predicted phage head-tail adaptor
MKNITSFLNNIFAVYRTVRTDDGQGGHNEALVHVGDIAGRLRPTSASERNSADQLNVMMSHVLYCAATEDIQRGDTVVGAGADLKVIAVRDPSYEGHHYQVDCDEIVREPQAVQS